MNFVKEWRIKQLKARIKRYYHFINQTKVWIKRDKHELEMYESQEMLNKLDTEIKRRKQNEI